MVKPTLQLQASAAWSLAQLMSADSLITCLSLFFTTSCTTTTSVPKMQAPSVQTLAPALIHCVTLESQDEEA